MCGIAGLLARPERPAAELEILSRSMADAIIHRGPDDEGLWTDAEVGLALAHRRLAVVGLGEVGHQPMVSRSGRWILVYNGEIYNALDLTTKLEASGTRFRGTSDTEVLVEALDSWGVDKTLQAINGMFAFGAWDRQERKLILARDRLGEKPLLYGNIDGAFAFASELRALTALPGAPTALDPDAVALFLRFKYIPAPFTIHRGINKLPPGHVMEVGPRPTDVGDPRPYWSLADVAEAGSQDLITDEREALDELDRVIGKAVKLRLRSDVPIGAFLSGGIDSSIVATHAAEHLDRPLQTFTIASDDPDHDESASAREIASRLGAQHTELTVTANDALERVPTIASVYDEPFADSSQLPTLLVSELARKDVTVVLSGDGGDEIFGGYNRHVFLPRVWDRAGKVPFGVRRAAARAMTIPSPGAWDRAARIVPENRRPRLMGLKIEKLASVLECRDAPAAYARLVSHWNEPGKVVRGSNEPATLTHRPADWPDLPTFAEQMMAVDAVTYMPDDVLVKVDRATMHVSLEPRVPLIDHDLIEFAWRLPQTMRIREGTGKWALRQLLYRRHPAELIDRPKAGFGVPIALWLGGPLRPWAEELLSEQSLAAGGLLDPAPIRKAWADHLAGRRDASYELWDVLMLQGWRSTNGDLRS